MKVLCISASNILHSKENSISQILCSKTVKMGRPAGSGHVATIIGQIDRIPANGKRLPCPIFLWLNKEWK